MAALALYHKHSLTDESAKTEPISLYIVAGSQRKSKLNMHDKEQAKSETIFPIIISNA